MAAQLVPNVPRISRQHGCGPSLRVRQPGKLVDERPHGGVKGTWRDSESEFEVGGAASLIMAWPGPKPAGMAVAGWSRMALDTREGRRRSG
jgi:hypothetical protein